jgi:hypothetical protein
MIDLASDKPPPLTTAGFSIKGLAQRWLGIPYNMMGRDNAYKKALHPQLSITDRGLAPVAA